MKVLIVGGTGLLSTAITDQLVARDMGFKTTVPLVETFRRQVAWMEKSGKTKKWKTSPSRTCCSPRAGVAPSPSSPKAWTQPWGNHRRCSGGQPHLRWRMASVGCRQPQNSCRSWCPGHAGCDDSRHTTDAGRDSDGPTGRSCDRHRTACRRPVREHGLAFVDDEDSVRADSSQRPQPLHRAGSSTSEWPLRM